MTDNASGTKPESTNASTAVSLLARCGALLAKGLGLTWWPAVVASVVTIGINHFADERLKRVEVEMARETARIEVAARTRREAVEAFVREATSLNVLIPAMLLPISRENRLDAQARDRILDNLLRQQTALDDLLARLPPETRPSVTDYENAVDAFRAAVVRVRAVDDGMSAFISRASDLIAARDDVIEVLRPLRG